MYPTVVILLIETQRSMTDICEISLSNGSKTADLVAAEAHPATLGYLSFAVGPAHSVTRDDKVESQCSPGLWSQGRQEYSTEVNLDVKESQVGTTIAG